MGTRRGQLRDFLERIARHDGDDVGEPRAADVVGEFFGSRRIVFDGGQVPAGLPKAKSNPDGAIATSPADLERAPGAVGRNHEPKEPAVFFRDGQEILVGGSDLAQETG